MSPSLWRLSFVQVEIHLSLLLFSVPLSQNHSLGLVFKFLNHLPLIPPAQLVRKIGTKSDLCPQLWARCLECEKKEQMMLNWWENCSSFLPFNNSLFCVNSLLPQIFSVMTLSQLLLSWSWSARLVTPYSGGHLWVFWLADLFHYPRVGNFYFPVSLESQLWSHASLHCTVNP